MIKINIDKAKSVAHNIRRVAREEEFAPHDAIIMKQIPGNSLEEAEAARQAIRVKYEALQTDMDAAETPEELKKLLPITHK